MTSYRFATLVAVVAFAVALVLTISDSTNAKLIQTMLYGGLMALAVGQLD